MTPSDDYRTVFAWVADDWSPDVAPRSLPAARLWGDVVLELVAEAERLSLDPPIAIRRTAVFAWPTPLPPATAIGATLGRRVALTVRPAPCAAANIERVHEVVDPQSWRRLREWLIDRGHDKDFIDEDVVPLTDPTAPMIVERARASVESTSPAVLADVVTYFTAAARSYLETWESFASAPEAGDSTEIVVPAEAIVRVDR